MEAPKLTFQSKHKEFPISKGKDNLILTFNLSQETLQLILIQKKESNETTKFEKSFILNDLNQISKWFRLFDSLDEVFDDMVKLMENKKIEIKLEENVAILVYNINMEKIKEFEITLEKKELSKDELI